MHVHLVRFQVLDKVDIDTGQPIPLQPWEDGTWKDTVRVPPNSKVRVIMDFEDYLGKFPYHCHILDHEDHEMMRQFQATNEPTNCIVNGVCDPGEDCVICPEDCGQVSGAECGNGLCEAGDGENCVTCAADCAGKQNGSTSNQFCCGSDDRQVTGPIACGTDVSDDRCIDAAGNLFCRVAPRVLACCGDKLCEGQETGLSCQIDCAPLPCGNRVLEPPEECDDGNVVPGDGCAPTCVLEDDVTIYGTAEGGGVEVTVDGVQVSIPTTAGQTSEQVAQAIAAAIEADPVLSANGVTAFADGNRVVTTGSIDSVTLNDPGLSAEPPMILVPALSPVSLGLLVIALGGIAALAGTRRHSTSGS
jgi:cysteine-rich repeat protein